MILIYLLLNLIFAFQGLVEAWGYSTLGFRKDIKRPWLIMFRGLILSGVLAVAVWVEIEIVQAMLIGLSCILSFSFFHNGIYEVAKAKLQGRYTKFKVHFTDLSKTDKSFFRINWENRLNFFWFSIVILITTCLIKL